MINKETSQDIGRSEAFGETESKIVDYKSLPKVREKHRGQKIVLCHGAFDLIHLGHLVHFKQAKQLGDVFVVTLTGDKFITKKRSVSFSEQDRASQLAALEIVDYVSIIPEPSAVTAIEQLHPDFYVKGAEYRDLTLDKTKNIHREKAIIESQGGALAFTGGQTFSSTKLSHFLQNSSEAIQENPLLRNQGVKFKDISARKIPLEAIKDFVVHASDLKVCVIGETIIDEWVEVKQSNVSLKSKCVTCHEMAQVSQIGGAGIVALHVANFAKRVDFFSNSYGEVPPENMRIFTLSESELVKRRYIDPDSNFTLFESKKLDLEVTQSVQWPTLDDYDLVIFADFGHGLISGDKANELIANCKRAFVAVMAQVNSSNFGFNLPKKYKGVDYYSINKVEAELTLNRRDLSDEQLVGELFDLLRPEYGLSLTNGKEGATVMTKHRTFHLESLSEIVVDTIGCGDAYLAFSSLAAALNCDEAIVALAGNIGAAAIAQKRCNEAPVTESEFMTIAKIVI